MLGSSETTLVTPCSINTDITIAPTTKLTSRFESITLAFPSLPLPFPPCYYSDWGIQEQGHMQNCVTKKTGMQLALATMTHWEESDVTTNII